MIDTQQVIDAAKELGAFRYINRAAKNEPTHTFTIEQLQAFAEHFYKEGQRKGLLDGAERFDELTNNKSYSLETWEIAQALREMAGEIK